MLFFKKFMPKRNFMLSEPIPYLRCLTITRISLATQQHSCTYTTAIHIPVPQVSHTRMERKEVFHPVSSMITAKPWPMVFRQPFDFLSERVSSSVSISASTVILLRLPWQPISASWSEIIGTSPKKAVGKRDTKESWK